MVPSGGDYASADLKVAVFGDSFPAFSVGGMTFPSRLQDVLSDGLGKSVHILNFGRDGYGVIQIFKLAAARIAEWKPEFAIITFTTDDLTRVPIWRTSTILNGEERILTTVIPDPTPPPGTFQDTLVIDSRITAGWCEKARASSESDPMVQSLEFKFRRMIREAGYAFPDPLSFTHSFLAAKLIHGNSYSANEERFMIPRLAIRDYADSDSLRESIQALEGLGVPYIIVHLPISDEVASGRKAILSPGQKALWLSLERLAGRKVLAVSDFVDKPVPDPHRMDYSPTNKHPSQWGMKLYAGAVTRMLEQEGLISGN